MLFPPKNILFKFILPKLVCKLTNRFPYILKGMRGGHQRHPVKINFVEV